MNVQRGMSKVLFAIFLTQVLAISAAICICPCNAADLDAQNIDPISDHQNVVSQNVSGSENNNLEENIYPITVQGHITNFYEGCYYKLYIDKVLIGYGLEGLSGFKLVPGTTVETTAMSPCPDVSIGDCVEVHGYWSVADSPPIYFENQSYIRKIACATTNRPPISLAKPSGSKSGNIETTYSYTISAMDPERDPVEFIVDWGDGTTSETGFVNSGKSVSVSHTWSNAGIYWVKAKAIDNKGATTSWSKPLIVTIKQKSKPTAPASPTGPTSGYIGASYSFGVSATSPDNNQLRFTIDWGDGTTTETGFVKSGRPISTQHSWSDAGIYWVKARAVDSSGTSSSWSKPLIVTIKQRPKPNTPTMPIGPTTGSIGTIYKFAISGLDSGKGTVYTYATSAAGSNKEQAMYIFDWGDGTTSETGYVSLGRLASVSHGWSDAGIYWVKARTVDSNGASSSWSKPLIVTIKQNYRPTTPTNPTVINQTTRSAGPTSSNIGTKDRFSTSAMDPNKIFVVPSSDSIDPSLRY